MGVGIQLGLLLWKNFTYRRRQKFQLVVEILWPLFLFFILVSVRSGNKPLEYHECHFLNKALPSAGTISWMQGLICHADNRCFRYPTAGETPGVVENFNTSIFSRFLVDVRNIVRLVNNTKIQDVLSKVAAGLHSFIKRSTPTSAMKVKAYLKKNETFSHFIRTNTSLPPELVDELLGSHLELQVFSRAGLPVKQIACSQSILYQSLVARDAGLAESLQKALCSLPEPILQGLERSFISEVDWAKLFSERLTSGTAHVKNAVESLWSLLQHAELLAKEVSSMATFAEFLEALRVLSSRASGSNPLLAFKSLSAILCGHSVLELRNTIFSNAYEGSDFKSFLGRSDNKSAFCKGLIQNFECSPLSRILFVGKILYTPPTQATQKVMAEVNRTFQNLAKVHDVKEAWDDLGPLIYAFMEKSPEMRAIQNLLSTPGVVRVLEQQLRWNISTLQNFLSANPDDQGYTWRKAYTQVGEALGIMSQFIKCVSLDKIEAIASEEELVRRALKLLKQKKFWAGIVFLLPDSQSRSQADLPPHVQFKIRMDIDDVTRTDRIEDRFWNPGPNANPAKQMMYIWGGFVYIQDLVEKAVVRVHRGTSTHQPRTGIYLQQMPYPCFVDDRNLRAVNDSLPLFLTLAWIYSVAMIIKAVVHEKETRLKETMKIMGLTTTTLWLSWFLSSFIPFSISTALQVLILKKGDILHHSDPLVVFLFLTTFAVATISQCFLISTFFSRANRAAACGGLIYFSCYMPYTLSSAWRDHITFPIQLLVSLLSPVAFCFGCEYFSLYEEQGVGVQRGNTFSSPVEGDYYSFGTSGIMLLFDAFLYGMATVYIEAVFPGQYGIPKPWNFPFKKSYWFGKSSTDASPHPIPTDTFHSPEAILEEPPAHLNVGVSIRNLVKIYHGSNKIAVNCLSLDFYEGQITSFLGHNGAGKTTTMSVLTGLIPPTSGTAYIMGRDIRFEMDTIRKTLGMCPQHNVLFDILTVEEHIWFYGRLKGLSEMQVKDEMEQMIQDTGLPYKRQAPTKKLSGGMQRKLSVAIAFVGGSKVVFLDEPTAGVDPYSRRGIWELLLKYKAGRTIILSTHYMDEADLLGDRVAIISQGRLYCCGSSLFLKSKLGTGYYLTLVKREPNSIDVSQLTRLVQTFVPGAWLVEDIGQEVVYILPYSGTKDGSFGTLFRALDSRLNELSISGYGISDTSLEEIFLKVAEDTSIESPEAEEAKEMDHLHGGGLQASRQLTGLEMIFQQLHALLTKRFLYTIRSRRGFFAQIVLPALFIFIALLFTLVTPPFGNYPPLRLEPWMYGPQLTFFSDESPPGDRSSDQLLKALLDDPGFGTKCMKKEGDLKDPCLFPSYYETGFTVPEAPASTVEVFEKGNWTMANPSPECECSTGASRKMFPDCPEGAGGLPPPQMKTKTGDTLYNLTGRNISDYLVKTYPKIIREGLGTKDQVSEQRYGGFSLGARTSEALSTSEEVEAMAQGIRARLVIPAGSAFDKLLTNLPSFVDGLDTHQNMKVWFNNKGWHAMVSYVNVANNGLLRANLPSGADHSHYGITVINHPLNLTEAQQSRVALMDAAISLLVSICVMVAMSFIPASFVLFLIEERVNKSKHLQIISGMKPVLYWISNFAWDMCNYLISAGLVVIIFLCFQQKAYVSLDNFPALLLLLLLYGWSVTPMMYPASFFFNIPSSAYITLTCVNLFIGINTSVTTFILDFSEDPHLSNTNKLLKKYFLIFPHFCLGRGLMDMVTNQGMADAFGKFGLYEFVPPLSWDLVGKNLLAMTIDGVIFFIFTVLMDYHFFIRLPPFPTTLAPLGEEDEDVAKERNRITSGALRGDILVLKNLTKVYWMSKKPAVDRLCLGIPRGECFGLLGVNGAGKTSTFQMLTGDSQVTLGDAFLKGYSIITNIQDVHKNMGYCPQFDALYDLLTAREHLVFYCRLHRMPEDEIPGVVKLGLVTLGLTQYADRPAGEYSGGNKRKLSTAIALIGAPLVIFLDEPTTGMDPRAKRFLWNCILRLIKDGRSVVLTSHSMEECEALCTRMAIMVNGRFRCLGTVQHLKNKFGGGYTISLRISGTDPDTGPVEKFMQNSFPGIILKEKHHSSLQYQLPSHISSLANVFDILSANWSYYQIRDYSISQTTLDQVFVHFAKDQSG